MGGSTFPLSRTIQVGQNAFFKTLPTTVLHIKQAFHTIQSQRYLHYLKEWHYQGE